MPVVLALCSAITYGLADFSGGVASRRTEPLAVTAGAQVVGLAILPALLLLLPAPASASAIVVGVLAGTFGGLGLALYFTAMREGAMGVVSPLSAAAAAGVPVVIGLAGGERPALLAMAGIAVALPAVYLAARPTPEGIPAVAEVARAGGDGGAPRRRGDLPPGVLLGIGSGLAFGMFFVLLDMAPDDSGAWPLLGAKLGSVGVVVLLGLLRRRRLVPTRPSLPLVAASGVLDMLANLLFLLATREGLLSLVSVITSQYPVVVVILSVIVLREALGRTQRVGVGLALVAVAMIGLA